jgi:hypothetical protein
LPALSVAGGWTGLGIAALGWLNVALAIRVMHINENNYALIVIVPVMWIIGLAISFAGIFAIGIGAAVTVTGWRSGRPAILLGGLASVVLNICHIATLIRVYTRH